MSSSHEKFPDRTADFSKAGEEGGKAIENVTHSAASLLSSAKNRRATLPATPLKHSNPQSKSKKRPVRGR